MRAALAAAGVGVMAQPRSYSADAVTGWPWAADNGCFAATWDADAWLAWLDRMRQVPDNLFAVVPDVVGDAAGTGALWARWAPTVASLGYRTAWVAQDGAGADDIPDADAVFIGGSTEFKLSAAAYSITVEAKRRGLWVHMGRVNSLRRLRLARDWGADSADGTFLAFAPTANTPRLLRWLTALHDQPNLFGGHQ